MDATPAPNSWIATASMHRYLSFLLAAVLLCGYASGPDVHSNARLKAVDTTPVLIAPSRADFGAQNRISLANFVSPASLPASSLAFVS